MGRTVSLLCQTFLWGALLAKHRRLRVYPINSNSWPGQEWGRPRGLYTMNWGPREVQNQDTKAGGGCGRLVALRSLWVSPPCFPLQPQLTWMAQLVWGGELKQDRDSVQEGGTREPPFSSSIPSLGSTAACRTCLPTSRKAGFTVCSAKAVSFVT